MKKTLSRYHAIDLLLADEYANWTRDGAGALVDYIEEYEQATGQPIEFDPIALRCGWSEYASADEALEDYGLDSFVELDQVTTVLPFCKDGNHDLIGGVVVEQF